MTPEHCDAIRQAHIGKPKSPEHIAKLSGPNHYRWKGGVSRNMSKKEWRAIRALVLNRDEHRCRECGNDNQNSLVVHHIIHHNEGGPDTMENLITWCRSCHSRHHNTRHDTLR